MSMQTRNLATVVVDRAVGKAGRAPYQAVAAYLIRHAAVHEVPTLLRDIRRLLSERGYLEVSAMSARPLSPTVLRDIKIEAKRLYPSAKHISITTTIDQALVGGVKLAIGEYELDLSVDGQFKRFTAAALRGKR